MNVSGLADGIGIVTQLSEGAGCLAGDYAWLGVGEPGRSVLIMLV